MLNKRFQQFNSLMNGILSSKQNHNICSLTLKNTGQFTQIFTGLAIRKNVLHIQKLQLTIDYWIHEYDLL
jgi:hypothetical protein